jgi:hypothetical protein
VSDDFKKKIYNSFTISNIFDKVILYYLTFNKDLDENIEKFLEFHKTQNKEMDINKKYFPDKFYSLSENVDELTKKELLNNFKDFLNELETEIVKKINYLT